MPTQSTLLVGYNLRHIEAGADLLHSLLCSTMSCSAGKVKDSRQTHCISASRQFCINGNPKPDTLAPYIPTSTELFRPQTVPKFGVRLPIAFPKLRGFTFPSPKTHDHRKVETSISVFTTIYISSINKQQCLFLVYRISQI